MKFTTRSKTMSAMLKAMPKPCRTYRRAVMLENNRQFVFNRKNNEEGD